MTFAGQDIASPVLKDADMIDAYSVMQTDFMPEERTVQINDDGGFLAANLTAEQARSLADSPKVLDVVDDHQRLCGARAHHPRG